MKHIRLVLLFAMTLAFQPLWAGKAKADKMTVMSFSIRQIYPNEKSNRWIDRKEPCLEMFRDLSPDVACIQRVSPVQMQALLEGLPKYGSFFQSKARPGERQDKDYGQLILFDKEKLALVGSGVFWMSGTPDKAFSIDWGEGSPRPVVWVKLKVAKSGLEFFCFNLYPDPKSAEAQKYGLELAVKKIQEICGPSFPVFVCGDFSLEQRSWYLNHMNAWFLSARDCAKTSDESGSYHDFRYSAHIATDHIFYRNAGAIQFTVANDKYGGKTFISDHFPVYGVFNLSGDILAGPTEDRFVFEENTPPESDSLAFSRAEWYWKPLCDGAVYGQAQFPLFSGMQIISVVKYDRTKLITGLEVARNDKLREATSTQAKRVFAKAAVNAGYFDMKTGVPGTFISINGEQLGKNRPDYPFFRMAGLLRTKGHEMLITPTDSSRVKQDAAGWDYVLACGPLLLYGGEFIPHEKRGTYKVIDPRAMMGYDENGNDAFLVTVDGRFDGQATGVRFDELAQIAKFLGMTHAIALDGGGSRTLWNFKTECMNFPSDNKRFDHTGQRGVSNIIFIK